MNQLKEHQMYIVIHEFKTRSGKMRLLSCNLCKEIPVATFDEHTINAVIFTQVQPAVDYIDSLYENSKVTQMQRESMISNLYEQLGNYMVGRPYKMWCIEHEY